MPKYIYKLNDFGFSQKFKSPKIINLLVAEEAYEGVPCYDTKGIFDLYYILSDISVLIKQELNQETLSLVEELETYLFGSVEKAEEKLKFFYDSTVDKNSNFNVNDDLLKGAKKLDMKIIKKIFKDYIYQSSDGSIIEKNKIDSSLIFISTNYKSI